MKDKWVRVRTEIQAQVSAGEVFLLSPDRRIVNLAWRVRIRSWFFRLLGRRHSP